MVRLRTWRANDINNMFTEAILPLQLPALAQQTLKSRDSSSVVGLSLRRIFGQNRIQLGSLSAIG
jgi:hypothetical protein